jgi:hypothetical protein
MKLWYYVSEFCAVPNLSRLALRPTLSRIQRVLELSQAQSGRGVVLTTHPHLALRLTLWHTSFFYTWHTYKY